MADWGLYDAPGDDDFDVDDPDLDFDANFPNDDRALFPDLKAVTVSVMAAAGVSPSSSPRLPSPPPFTEVQIGPKSPTVGEPFGNAGEQLLGATQETDDASTRRIRPGTKAADMASGPPLIPLSQLDSPFQLQEHLKALYHSCTKPDSSRTVVPITRDVAMYLAEPPEGVERSLWLYELCRFLTMKVNNLIIAFFAEDPPCSSQTCPEMRASEWQYLCAVHDPPKSCCAIDYCCHTLDWATNILTSPKYFPSRLTLGSEAGGGPQASMRHLTNIFRRLYRIFAHAWFQHRDVFWQVEGHDGLYVFFKTVCDVYHLIPEDNYTIPPEAEGPDAYPKSSAKEDKDDGRRLTILRKDSDEPPQYTEIEPSSISTGATTRRHKHSPSTGSAVTTIAEDSEDTEDLSHAEDTGEKPSVVVNVPEATPEHAEQSAQQKSDDATPEKSTTTEPTETITEIGEPAPDPEEPETIDLSNPEIESEGILKADDSGAEPKTEVEIPTPVADDNDKGPAVEPEADIEAKSDTDSAMEPLTAS
ncbi:mob1 family protein [Paecilomyces variotii No. 5]|uniref:Mob1 family protein n=1 Tax=Byssochlamys spectabilis (strain No. 5 / NBRC 109023) TaxID=1356009 RepID=V5FV01_BYSSN|nr:mob1 family protein [Paecilomyces variotii No. 5]